MRAFLNRSINESRSTGSAEAPVATSHAPVQPSGSAAFNVQPRGMGLQNSGRGGLLRLLGRAGPLDLLRRAPVRHRRDAIPADTPRQAARLSEVDPHRRPKTLEELDRYRAFLLTSDNPRAREFGEQLAQLQLMPASGKRRLEKFKKRAYKLSEDAQEASARGEITEDDYLHAMNDLGVQFAARSPTPREGSNAVLTFRPLVQSVTTIDNHALNQSIPGPFSTRHFLP